MGPKPKKQSPTRSKSPNKANDLTFFTTNLNDVGDLFCFWLFFWKRQIKISFLLRDNIQEDWKILVAFVQPSNELDELYVEQLEKAVKKGHRRRFTWFSKKDLIDLVWIKNKKKEFIYCLLH